MDGTGKIIQELRIRAGFTQQTLAKALHITDKAISKWERGICLPDVGLLPKLALLLDIDVDILISKSIEQEEWAAFLDLADCDFSQPVFDKPLVYYLLSHFLLLGMNRIHVRTSERNRRVLESGIFGELGISFAFEPPAGRRAMILNHPWFIFGSDLTQQFQGAMVSERNIRLTPEKQPPVAFFAQNADSYLADREHFQKTAANRTLGRGMICLDMGNRGGLLDVAVFVRTYQANAGLLIGSLEEIALGKGFISRERLAEIAPRTPCGERLLKAGKPKVD